MPSGDTHVPLGTHGYFSGVTQSPGSLGDTFGSTARHPGPLWGYPGPFWGQLGAKAPFGKCPQAWVHFGDPWKSRTLLGSPRCWDPLGTHRSLGEGMPRALGPPGDTGTPPLTTARGLLGGDSECMLSGSLEGGTTASSLPVTPVTPLSPLTGSRGQGRLRSGGKYAFKASTEMDRP